MPQDVTQRYARALAAVTAEKDYASTAQELDDFARVYQASVELREVFDSPAVTPERKLGVLNAILERLGTPRVTANFLRVLLRHYRVNLIEEIGAAFRAVTDERLGIAEMMVTSAAELNDAQASELARRFGEITGKRVRVTFSVDPALVGGVVAQIKSTIYDGSVRGALDDIQKQMTVAV